MKWLRWYRGTCEDIKFRIISNAASQPDSNGSVTLRRVTVGDAIAIWAFMLEDAASEKHRGIVTRNADFIAACLSMDKAAVHSVIDQMCSLGMLSDCGDTTFRVVNWAKWQFDTDLADGTNAIRQKRWRNRHKTAKKQDSNGTVTPTVTPPKRPDTELELDTEAERKKDIPEPAVRFAFERGKVRLTEKDFDAWQSSFTEINLRAELEANYEWAAEQKNWFIALKGLLAKRNREAKLQREAIKVGVALATQPRKVGGGFA